MNRQILIDKIVFTLNEEGVLDQNNYYTRPQQCQDVQKIIEKILADYVIIEGHVI